ncbi:MAG: biotin/lipoyl-containing protein [Candidatus Thalassarchaeaceae archaeon]|jgi:biotin carboxyl carrier protein|nr:biotin/lipoyl-containing protein [Candidatus Thalassarchaeaceae archaeon]|tara:strand:+ start:1270 stop:1677 length:408 start_codon:yes stop_codon:yes gene_type:complete
MSEKRKVTVDGEEFEVMIEKEGESWIVQVGGKTFTIEMGENPNRGKGVRKPRNSRKGKVSGVVSSPIPGKIVSVNISEGDEVSEGDVIMVLEAMKMQNEIQAPIGGVVTELNCSPGETIEANSPLIVIDPGEDGG